MAGPIVHSEAADIDVSFGKSRWLFGDEMDAIRSADQVVGGRGMEQGRAGEDAKEKSVESGHGGSKERGAGSEELSAK